MKSKIMAKIKDLAKIERPREKLIVKGLENFKDNKLLVIMGTTYNYKRIDKM